MLPRSMPPLTAKVALNLITSRMYMMLAHAVHNQANTTCNSSYLNSSASSVCVYQLCFWIAWGHIVDTLNIC
jgi:hypothetical protein